MADLSLALSLSLARSLCAHLPHWSVCLSVSLGSDPAGNWFTYIMAPESRKAKNKEQSESQEGGEVAKQDEL